MKKPTTEQIRLRSVLVRLPYGASVQAAIPPAECLTFETATEWLEKFRSSLEKHSERARKTEKQLASVYGDLRSTGRLLARAVEMAEDAAPRELAGVRTTDEGTSE